ncbi:MAG TPA: aminoglycoside phosphotransferase family protein [Dehalococcoidia bacterium]|nr:aminoglycoside phosphotransferase family protein [Dehalococcoidia bacterium]
MLGGQSRAVPSDLQLERATRTVHGRAWREALPALVAALARDWVLRLGAPFPGLSYNYVAPAELPDGSPVVLKVWSPDDREFAAEVEALRLYDGDGAVRLLRVQMDARAMLLERAEPGTDLWRLADEGRQIEITASIMRRLWRAPPAGSSLLRSAEEFERMEAVAPALARDGFPLRRVKAARAIMRDLEAEGPLLVLHEDLHQANILASQREPWLAIDPHGVIGPPALDAMQMILNVIWRELDPAEWRKIAARYVAALAEALGLEREALRLAGVARCVLEAFWTLEDHGRGWEKDIAAADAFAAAI